MPRLTFRAGTLSRFMQRHEIGMVYKEIPYESQLARKFKITLTRPVGKSQQAKLKTTFTQGFGLGDTPDLERVLWAIGSDLWEYELSEGSPEYYMETFGVKEDVAWDQFVKVQSLAERMQSFLGFQGYEEFVQIIMQGEEE